MLEEEKKKNLNHVRNKEKRKKKFLKYVTMCFYIYKLL